MPTVTKAQLATRVDELTRELHTLRAANSETFSNVSKLIEENNRLKAEAVNVGAAASKPAAIPVISRTEQLISKLEKYEPNARIVCKQHGPGRANKHGVCPVCFCNRVRNQN